MIKRLKKTFLYIEVFAVTALMSMILLTASALIPRSAIHQNMFSSADFLSRKHVFFTLIDKNYASRIDRYADSILLNIAYNYDSDDPLRSVMLSEYYYTFYQNENINFLDAVGGEHPANQQYLRYWHGMALPVRIMHLFTDIRGMYIINGVVMIILTGLLLIILIRNRLYAGAVGILFSLAAVSVWFVPFSLEYTSVFILMLIMSLLSVKLSLRGKYELLLKLFMVCGILTCFFDFLTCETITLLVPLLLAVYIRRRDTSFSSKKTVFYSVKACILWGIGYVGMWVTKWIIAAITLGEDVMPYIKDNITERLFETNGESTFTYIFGGLWRNFNCLFPFGYGIAGIIAAIIIILGIVGICILFYKKRIEKSYVIMCTVLGMIPYIRFIVIHNHSYLHFFFTYRAQAATILALCLITAEIIRQKASAPESIIMNLKNKEELDLSVVMPCLNESATVGSCIDEAKRFIDENCLAAEVIVVDNGSTDGSDSIAREHGAVVIPEPSRGYGRAIRTGIENSRGSVIIIGDCDTTYDFSSLGSFFSPLSNGEYDIVIGDRFAGGIGKGAMPAIHKIGIPFLSWCGRVKFRVDVRDFHCGLRGITRKTAETAIYNCDGMEFATEMIADAARHHLKIGQTPTVLRKCICKRRSKLKTFRDGIRHLRYILNEKNVINKGRKASDA